MRFGIFLLAVVASAQDAVQIRLVGRDWLLDQLRELPANNADRVERLQDLFAKVGCKSEPQRVKSSRYPNIVCTLPGEGPDTIVVGAHFDKVSKGRGTIDNGSGTLLLPSLYAALSSQPRHHTYVFVGFTDEEQGLVGSKAFVRAIPKDERSRYRAMVNIDSLGLGPATVWHHQSHPELLKWLETILRGLEIKGFRYMDVDGVGDGDSTSFKQVDIPVIDFHSITTETFHVLHSEADSMRELRPDDYFAAYRLIAYYLAYVDGRLKESPLTGRRKR